MIKLLLLTLAALATGVSAQHQNLLRTDMTQWVKIVGDSRFVEIGATKTEVWWRPRGVINQRDSWGGCFSSFAVKSPGDYLVATQAFCCGTGWERFDVEIFGPSNNKVWSSSFNRTRVNNDFMQWRVRLGAGTHRFYIRSITRNLRIDRATFHGAIITKARRPVVTFNANRDTGPEVIYWLHRSWPNSALLLFVSKQRRSSALRIPGIDGDLWLAAPVWAGTSTTQTMHRSWQFYDTTLSGVFWQVLEVNLSKFEVRLGSRNYTSRSIRDGF